MSKSSLAKLSCMFMLGLVAAVAVPFTGSAQTSIIGGTTNRAPTTVTTVGKTTHAIEGGARAQNNLFHTFMKFQLDGGDVALFRDGANAQGQTIINPAIQNVIARVADPAATLINGVVDTKAGYPNASLYLLSPSGITIGNKAQFNVVNYAYLTTADSIKFADGRVFSADPATASTLSVAAVSSFGFTGTTFPNIDIPNLQLNGGATLTVDPFTTVAFVGGRILVSDKVSLTATDNARFEFVTVSRGDIGVRETAPRQAFSDFDLQSNFGFGTNIVIGNNVTINPGEHGLLRIGDFGLPGHTEAPFSFTIANTTLYKPTATGFGWNFLPANLKLSPSLSTVETGKGGTLAVELSGKTATGLTVNLASSNPEVASVKPSVTLGVGTDNTSVNFTTAALAGTATIKASLSLLPELPPVSDSARIQVNPVSDASISLSSLGILQNTIGTLTVTLSKAASESTTVNLRSLNPSVLSVPNSVIITRGSQSESFSVKGLAIGNATVTAQSGSSTTSNVVQVTPFVIPTTATQLKGGNENQSQSATVGPPLFYAKQLALNMDRCSTSKGGEFSSFVQRGRDRIPFQPGQFLSSPLALDGDPIELGALPVQPAVASAHAPILNLAPNIAPFLELNQGC